MFVKFLEKLGGIWTWLPIYQNKYHVFFWHFLLTFLYRFFCRWNRPKKLLNNIVLLKYTSSFLRERNIKGTSSAHGWNFGLQRNPSEVKSFVVAFRADPWNVPRDRISAMPCGCPNKCDPSAYKVGFWRFGFGGKNPQGDPIVFYIKSLSQISDLGPWFFWLDQIARTQRVSKFPCFGLLGRRLPLAREFKLEILPKVTHGMAVQVRDEQKKVDVT